MSLAKECYSVKLDLITNATVVDDAIGFVSMTKDNPKSSKEESKKPAYDEDRDLIEDMILADYKCS